MTDEKYVFIKDSAEKKRIARGYHKMSRTGKGRVRFPDDNLTRKEKAGLSKDLGTYKMGEPVYWKEFRTWPEEFQKEHLLKIYEKFDVGDGCIGKMMGVSYNPIGNLRKKFGISRSRGCNPVTQARKSKEFENWVSTFRGVDNVDVEDEYPINTSDKPYKLVKPTQTEKFNLRYSHQGVEKEPIPENKLATEYTAPVPKPRPDIVDPMELMFRAYNVDDNFDAIIDRLRGALMMFRQCPEVQIEIKAPARKNPPPAGKDSGRELNDKGQPRIVGFGE